MNRASRRTFLQCALPAATLLGNTRSSAARLGGGTQSVPLPEPAKNAIDYAKEFLRSEVMHLEYQPPGARLAVGCIYGMAATVEAANGTPVAVSFLDSDHAGRAHEPMLWAAQGGFKSGGVPPTVSDTVVGWSLADKIISFEGPTTGSARYIQPSEISHGWQAPANIPLLNQIQPGASALDQDKWLSGSVSKAVLLLNQGVLETGVPWSMAGKICLWWYSPTANSDKLLTAAEKRKVYAISDNELWSFALPQGADSVSVMYRPLADPKAAPQLLTTLFNAGSGSIAFFLSNDLPKKNDYVRVYRPVAQDAAHFWKATTHASNIGAPLVARTVYGHTSFVPSVDDNDGEPHCIRARVRMR